MKTRTSIILSIILILAMFIACKKEPVYNPAKDITGRWKWLSTYLVSPDTVGNPLTPKNTGIQEELVFNANYTWSKTQNKIITEYGTYSIGHGSYTPYPGAHVFIYDSIVYYQNGKYKNGCIDYYDIYNDTLQFCGAYAGKFSSYSLPYNGTKILIKE
jgi:hypothetical protein